MSKGIKKITEEQRIFLEKYKDIFPFTNLNWSIQKILKTNYYSEFMGHQLNDKIEQWIKLRKKLGMLK